MPPSGAWVCRDISRSHVMTHLAWTAATFRILSVWLDCRNCHAPSTAAERGAGADTARPGRPLAL